MARKPIMFMVAGPNGAGKSTLYETRIKPHTAAPFINADIIQRDELKDPSMQASYKAAELAEARRQEYLAQGKSFVSESTFSHPSKLALIEEAKAAGFSVVMYHVNLRSPELSVSRVAKRFGEGGHDVPEDKIRERFARNPALIRQAVLLSDRAYVYDNSVLNRDPALAVKFKHGEVVQVSDQVPAWARELYSKELEPFSPTRLNPAAASFADAKAIVQKLGGGDVVLRIPDQTKNHTHKGKMVGETALHWVQKVQGNVYLAHFKAALPSDIELQRSYQVNYTEHGRANAQLVRPQPTPDTPRDAEQGVTRQQLAATAFLQEPPEQAMKRFPELAGAYLAMVTFAKALDAQGVGPAVHARAMAAGREELAARIGQGQALQVPFKTPPTLPVNKVDIVGPDR